MPDFLLINHHIPGINPVSCGTKVCAPGHRLPPEASACYVLYYASSGTGMLHNSRGVHPVLPGQLFVLRPGESSACTADSRRPWRCHWVGFETSLDCRELLAEDVLDGQGCGEIFEQILSSAAQPDPAYLICGKVYELLHTLRQTKEPPPDSLRYVRLAQDFIRANYMREITVEGIARGLGLDRSYFSRLFKKHTGHSPRVYLVDYRMTKAAELLRRGISCTQAAAQAGYPDPAQFSRMFRHRYGVAPGRYSYPAQGI